MPSEEQREVVRTAFKKWGESDLEGFLSLLANDVVYTVNVSAEIPYSGNTVGVEEMRARLAILLDTFVINAFVIDTLIDDGEALRPIALAYFKHKKTGERLDIKIRFRIDVEDGLITRIDEFHDAAYVEAFEKFVKYLEQTAIEQGGMP